MVKVKSLRVASDKSITHRAIMLSSVAKGTVKITNPLYSEDTLKTLKAIQSMGVKVSNLPGHLIVKGRGKGTLSEPYEVIDLGSSGTSMRLLSGLIGGEGVFVVLTGDDSLKRRPMMRIIDPLSKMGINFMYREGGYAPLAIKGGIIRGINFNSRIASAQVKSAILLAGLYTDEEVKVLEPVKSRDHTENLLKFFGVDVKSNGNLVALGKNRDLIGDLEINVPADISSAAYFMVFASLKKRGRVVLRDVLLNPTRNGILEILDAVGANYSVDKERVENFEKVGDIEIWFSNKLKPFEISKEILPRLIDEIPILSILAIYCDGISKVRGAGDLRKKESDRIKAVCENLNRLGVKTEEYEDGFDIYGDPTAKLKPAKIETFNDHRIAMSFLILKAAKNVDLRLSEMHSILTSYPNFMDHLNYINS